MTRIKICGITNKIDAVNAARYGTDMLGFVFYPKSKRYVEPMTAADIINELPTSVTKVGVFVDEPADRVIEIARNAALTMLQFHGSETAGYCAGFKDSFKVIKAFRVKSAADLKTINDYDVDYCLLDTYAGDSIGGTGEVFDWKILKDFEILKPVILAGGLTPSNVAKAIEAVAPYGVDVSTGVEASPGKKDPVLMERFINEVRKAG